MFEYEKRRTLVHTHKCLHRRTVEYVHISIVVSSACLCLPENTIPKMHWLSAKVSGLRRIEKKSEWWKCALSMLLHVPPHIDRYYYLLYICILHRSFESIYGYLFRSCCCHRRRDSHQLLLSLSHWNTIFCHSVFENRAHRLKASCGHEIFQSINMITPFHCLSTPFCYSTLEWMRKERQREIARASTILSQLQSGVYALQTDSTNTSHILRWCYCCCCYYFNLDTRAWCIHLIFI